MTSARNVIIAATVLALAALLVLGRPKHAVAPRRMPAMPTALPEPSVPAASRLAEPASRPSGNIVASVNGEPIYESELLAGLPDDAFAQQLEDMKRNKLKRLVETAVRSQFLKGHQVEIPSEQLDEALKRFEQMVTAPGCPCCTGGGYDSVDQFMKVNAYTPTELRRRVACDIGLSLYADRLAAEQATPEALAQAVNSHRAQIEADYVRACIISFEYRRDPDYYVNEKLAQDRKAKLASEALQRLKKGDSFEKVAEEMSEDEASAPKGGALGCVQPEFLGAEVEQALRTLEPGSFSEVIKTRWKCCIVMRQRLTEEDILSLVKGSAGSFADDQVRQELKAARADAAIEYSDNTLAK